MQAIRTEAQLTSFRSRADGGMGFSGVTPELSSSEKVALFNLQNVLVELLIYPKDEKNSEVLIVKAELEGKTPCQRLRGVVYVHYDQTGKPGGDFETFYRGQMDKIIEGYKQKNLQ